MISQFHSLAPGYPYVLKLGDAWIEKTANKFQPLSVLLKSLRYLTAVIAGVVSVPFTLLQKAASYLRNIGCQRNDVPIERAIHPSKKNGRYIALVAIPIVLGLGWLSLSFIEKRIIGLPLPSLPSFVKSSVTTLGNAVKSKSIFFHENPLLKRVPICFPWEKNGNQTSVAGIFDKVLPHCLPDSQSTFRDARFGVPFTIFNWPRLAFRAGSLGNTLNFAPSNGPIFSQSSWMTIPENPNMLFYVPQ